MAESKELGLPKTAISLKEQLARTTLRNLRSQGHTYIELREDGKRFVFFCTLCLAPCYSDAILLGHLNGNLHKERLSCARITLLGENPWPFNDGVLFFDSSTGEEEKTLISDGEGVTGPLHHCSDNERFAIVTYDENRTCESQGDNQPAAGIDDEPNHCAENLVISNLLIKEKTLDVEAKFIGFGRIAARLFETKGRTTWIDKLWCEWLGEESPPDEEKATVPEHDFAIVTFSYFYNLGRLGLLADPSRLLTLSQSAESGNGEDNGRKRKKSFSDPEDTSESLCNQYDSSEEVSSARNSNSSRALIADYDDHLVNKRVIKNKSVRRELRKQQRIFSDRICEVCKQKMLPGKDAAAILNMKTGKLACSSRNRLGAFHLFHVSCVVHWFLFCETEILGSKMVSGKGKKRCTKQSGVKWNELVGDVSWQIFSVFCPECQGTGINIEGDVIERDTFPLSQTWRFGVKVSEGRKAWVKNPEKLENCSTGFHFPQQDEELVKGQEDRVQSMKLVRFYRVEL
ncbi:hypothetical protein EUTSA_v10024944mg [Eutrema salsugineum]|uniref:C2H2-type domain-containing protein n=1 Tax=Eutrema salsugineum TaxID=72664 RepID=V4P4L5_EUTSA|nr:uncharacterized protein LOC18028906 [Eutrema salsugineum]ESQ54431.1 hypothetical protein EUTSA_v10024944mg [Eutrema salsugineum]